MITEPWVTAEQVAQHLGVAKELLTKLIGGKLQIDHWREKATAQAQVKAEILKHLYAYLPSGAYDAEEINLKANVLFAHIYTAGVGEGGCITEDSYVASGANADSWPRFVWAKKKKNGGHDQRKQPKGCLRYLLNEKPWTPGPSCFWDAAMMPASHRGLYLGRVRGGELPIFGSSDR